MQKAWASVRQLKAAPGTFTMKASNPSLPPDLDQPDRFQQFLFQFVDRVYRKRKLYGLLGLIMVGLGLGFWYWQELERQALEAEANLFFAAQQAALRAAQQRQPQQEAKALSHYLEQAETLPLKVASQLQLAEVYGRQGDWASAEAQLRTVIATAEIEDFTRNLARLNLASVLEAQSKWEDARQVLLQLDNARWDDLRLRGLSRLNLAQGKTEEARQQLTKLAEMNDSPFQQEAADQLRLLR